MYVWSKRLVIAILVIFMLGAGILAFTSGNGGGQFGVAWITLNYIGLMVWIFVWMIDQTRVRGKNIWAWLPPFIVAPLPTLMALVLFLQRRMKT